MFIHNARYVAALGIFPLATDATCHLWAGHYRDFGIDNQQLPDAIAEELRTTIAAAVYICQQGQENRDNDAVFIHLAADQASIAARQIPDVPLQKGNAGTIAHSCEIGVMAPVACSRTRPQTTIPTGERHREHPHRTVSAYPRIRRQGVPHAANR
ncbi:hypothetical protein [Collimonas sp. PA-H2]|uniref:hypothetical protein n=1 Tax=Collimonas sp. PA-H2 TaxID=1881062 RepID=UPI0013043286|nr:hypothetical protein [Collimonas sp. PA-H2]